MNIKLDKEDIDICIYLLVNKYKVPSKIIKNLLGVRVSSNGAADIQVLTKILLEERGINLFTGSDKEVRELKRHLLKQIPENVLTNLYNKNPVKNRVISSPSYMISPLVKKKWIIGGAWPRSFVETLGFPLKFSGVNVSPKKIPGSESSRDSQPKGKKHYQSCSNCKNAIIDMFRAIYGTVKIEHKMDIKARIEDYKKEYYYNDLLNIYNALKVYRGNETFVRSKILQPCDLYIPDPGFVVELDESQHFSSLREQALNRYPENLQVGFDLNKWVELCKSTNAKDGNPYYRDEQRAWYDTLRDFLPYIKGLQPTVRISIRDYNWCSLNPKNNDDIELFKSLVLNNQSEDQEKYRKDQANQITIATVCLKSNGCYTNVSRTELLFQLIEKLDGYTDLILLPAGFYQTHDSPNTLYDELNDVIGKKLEDLNSSLSICLGIDGRDGLDQLAILITKHGIEGIGRKFYPTSYEEIARAESYLSLEEGYERVFQIKEKRFYMAVCYDGFGIKKQKLKNPNVDIILDLVHRFHPIGEDISGDVLFAKHGFAGASKQWGCPVFGAAVFFNREVPTKWPTGVMWQTNKESTRYWRYTDNSLKHHKELVLQDEELANIRYYTV